MHLRRQADWMGRHRIAHGDRLHFDQALRVIHVPQRAWALPGRSMGIRGGGGLGHSEAKTPFFWCTQLRFDVTFHYLIVWFNFDDISHCGPSNDLI